MKKTSGTTPPPPHLAGDLLRGADAIAQFVFGDTSKRRKVHHLARASRPPVLELEGDASGG